jgi:CSLREA domain-containing protein
VQIEVLEDRQLLSTITVNSTADDTTPDATLSLREAIEVSNGTLPVSSLSTQEQALVSGPVGSTNTIDFNVPKTDPGYNATTGVWTIAPGSNLPTITKNAAIIDGYSQPGASKNSLAIGDNAKLVIALNGAGASAYNGLTIDQPGSRVSGLDIENFSVDGVRITAAGNVQVAGCFIGTDATGETAAGNGIDVQLDNSSNQIGGGNVADRNVISASDGQGPGGGVYVPAQQFNPLSLTPTGNVIENNYIGLDASGTKALANTRGVQDDGSGDTYGGTGTGVGNVISGNTYGGLISNSSITVQGNFIGTDATGNVAIGNGQSGDGMFDNQVTAGPITVVATNNVVSGNYFGIRLDMLAGSLASYQINNNLIGTNAAGTAGLGNSGEGVELDGVNNLVMQNNVISANSEGVRFDTPDTLIENAVVQGNKIGTDVTGTHALGNQIDGIMIYSGSGLTIGGTGSGQANTIAYNGQFGIELYDGQQDRFTQNTIVGNKGAGIYEGWGYNHFANPPVLYYHPDSGTLSGTLSGAPSTTYTIEVFSNAAAEAAGNEQGTTFVQDVTLKTDASGKGSFSLSEPSGAYYTATATDPGGDTSAFSNSVGAQQGLPASTTALSSSLNPSLVGQPVTFTAVVSAPGYKGTPTGTVTFTIDGHPGQPVQLSMVGGQDEAQFVTSTLTAGEHSVSATYSGDTNVSGSSESLFTQIVNKPNLPPTTTTLGSSLDRSTVGQQVTFTAVVSPGRAKGTPAGTVTFTIDGHAEPPVALYKVNGIDEASFAIETLTVGNHTVSASYSGDPTFAGSVVTQPLVQQVDPANHGGPPPADGPTVVSLDRFGIHMQPTVLVLTFNDGLDPTSARDMSNYKIAGPDGRTVGISSVTFDPVANTVTIRPSEKINLHHTYELTVFGTSVGGVKDAQGVYLDGANNGHPGSNYNGTLTWRNVVWTPAEAKKYVHPKHVVPAGALSHRFLTKSH